MSFLQEFAVELDGWANEPLQSSARQIFQTTTGKYLQNCNISQKLKEKLSNKPQRQILQKLQARQLFEVIDYILVHRSNVDCEWRIEGPTGHFLSFNFQQVLVVHILLKTLKGGMTSWLMSYPLFQFDLPQYTNCSYGDYVQVCRPHILLCSCQALAFDAFDLPCTTRSLKTMWQSQCWQPCVVRLQSHLLTPLAAPPGHPFMHASFWRTPSSNAHCTHRIALHTYI